MLGTTDLGTYALGAFLIVLLPGPNSLYTLSVAARGGLRDGYRAATGVLVGDTVLMTLSAAGVASLLKTNEAVYSVVKYLAGAYLLWLGIGMLRAAWRLWRELGEHPTETTPATTAPPSPGPRPSSSRTQRRRTAAASERPFCRALVISLLNPKAILFFISFFIQFVDPGYPHPALPFLVLGAILTAFSALYLSLLVFTGTSLAAQFRKRRHLSAGLSSAVGALFMGFAAKLALSSTG